MQSHPSTRWAATRFRTFATVAASHLTPRAVATPRLFKAAAIWRSDFGQDCDPIRRVAPIDGTLFVGVGPTPVSPTRARIGNTRQWLKSQNPAFVRRDEPAAG